MNNDDDEFEYDVFISYSSKNSDWVIETLLPRLEEAGSNVCVDQRDFRPGVPSVNEMERAVKSSRKIIAVLTPAYLDSGWAEFELLMTQTLSPANRTVRLVPVLREKCELPIKVGYLTYVNLGEPRNAELEWQRLLNAVKRPTQILVVDDEPDVQKTLAGLLRDTGYGVYLAANESDAILKRGKEKFDFLVVDIGLEGGLENDEGGLRLAQDFRKFDEKIRIIVLTGKGTDQNIIRAFRDMRVNDFIKKSPDMGKNLLASIQKLSENIH